MSPLASDDEPTDEESAPQFLSDEERDLLVKRRPSAQRIGERNSDKILAGYSP